MDNEKCRLLIDIYKNHRALWDPQHKHYFNKRVREDCWTEIQNVLDIPVAELKAKMKSLMGTYRREKSRQKQSQVTGSGMYLVFKCIIIIKTAKNVFVL